MMRIMLGLVTVAVLVFGGAYFDMPNGLASMAAWAATGDVRLEAAKPARRFVIGLDLSQSNPLITDRQFARKLAERVASEIGELGYASEVHVRTFGSYETSANDFHYDAVLSIHQRPADVGAEVAKLIASTPELIEKGVWHAQAKTNILAFLDNASAAFGCSGEPTSVVLLSDGIEDSEYAHLARANSDLPAPSGAPFKGCAELQILGLGQGQPSPEKTKQLRAIWSRWASAAGFQSFLGLNDW